MANNGNGAWFGVLDGDTDDWRNIRQLEAPALKLKWYQRHTDQLWNADCACGATVTGFEIQHREAAEEWHFKMAESARQRGNKYLPCGVPPKCASLGCEGTATPISDVCDSCLGKMNKLCRHMKRPSECLECRTRMS